MTSVVSTALRRSMSGSWTSASPVCTACVRPESWRSIERTSSDDRGFPRIRPSSAMVVSAATMIAGPMARAATSSALASASRRTRALAASPGNGVSSTAEDSTWKCSPALRRTSARRMDADARISRMRGGPPPEYYRPSYASAASASALDQPKRRATCMAGASG